MQYRRYRFDSRSVVRDKLTLASSFIRSRECRLLYYDRAMWLMPGVLASFAGCQGPLKLIMTMDVGAAQQLENFLATIYQIYGCSLASAPQSPIKSCVRSYREAGCVTVGNGEPKRTVTSRSQFAIQILLASSDLTHTSLGRLLGG